MNLVSIIMQMLTPDLLGKLASGIGGDKSLVQKAAGASIPAILAGLAGVAGQPGGGSLITSAISKLDPGMMGSLASILGGSGQSALATTGTNILGGLLGNSALGTLAGAVGKFSGLGGTASTGLLGALVPMVLGSIGQQQKSMGLDAGGVAKLLGDQKANITAALPGDFSKLLSGTGLLDGVMGQAGGMASSAAGMATGAAGMATGAAGAASGMASKAASSMSSTASSAASSMSSKATSMAKDADDAAGGFNWLPWVIGLLALGAIAWFLMGRGAEKHEAMAPAPAPAATTTAPAATTAAAPAATAAAPAMAHIMAGDVDISGMMSGAMTKLTTALPAIKDEATAKAALPDLTAAGDAVAKVAGMTDKIPADGKTALAAMIKTGMAAMGPMVTAAESNPAAGAIVKPVMDGIMAKLDAMSK